MIIMSSQYTLFDFFNEEKPDISNDIVIETDRATGIESNVESERAKNGDSTIILERSMVRGGNPKPKLDTTDESNIRIDRVKEIEQPRIEERSILSESNIAVERKTEDWNALFGSITKQSLIDRETLTEALKHAMHNISLEKLVLMLTNEFNEVLEYARLCRGEDACRRTSLLVNPHRLSTRCGNSISIYESLQEEKFFKSIARSVLWRENGVQDLLYQVLQTGYDWIQWAAEFAPIVAHKLCRRYDLKEYSQVLDPCAGWGGRMLGVSTLVNNYTCYDPSTKTINGLIELGNFIKNLRPNFTATLFNQPYEDSDEFPGYYDFAITSPPYYDTEKYSNEETNSLNRYNSYDEWCSGFYFPLIDKTMRQLKPNAVFIFNIGDRRYPLSKSMFQHCENRYNVKRLDNYLGYNTGQGRNGDLGEKFYEISHAV